MTKPLSRMTPQERERYEAAKAARRSKRTKLTPQDHMEMVLLYALGLWSLEAIAAAYGVSLKTLRNARSKYPFVSVVWTGED